MMNSEKLQQLENRHWKLVSRLEAFCREVKSWTAKNIKHEETQERRKRIEETQVLIDENKKEIQFMRTCGVKSLEEIDAFIQDANTMYLTVEEMDSNMFCVTAICNSDADSDIRDYLENFGFIFDKSNEYGLFNLVRSECFSNYFIIVDEEDRTKENSQYDAIDLSLLEKNKNEWNKYNVS